MTQLGKAQKGGDGKGGKKGKKGKKESNPQQKKLMDKMKAMEQADYLKRLHETAKAELKEKLSEEKEMTRVNKLNIQNQWRKMMRMAKVETLRKEIEILSQNHERDVDRKDAIIQMLDRDLEEAEEQYQMALRSHLQNIDRLIDIQDQRLLNLENEFENDLNTLTDEFRTEQDHLKNLHDEERTELGDIISAVEATEMEKANEEKQEQEQVREETKNKYLEDVNVLRVTLEGVIEGLEHQFEAAHLNYLQNTDQRTQEFKHFTRRDQELSKEIELKIRKIERLHGSIAHWRTKITQNMRECEGRNQALRTEKETVLKHFQELKSRMDRFRVVQNKRLTELTRNARRCKGTLGDHVELASRILKQGELCARLETEQEAHPATPAIPAAVEHEPEEATEGEKATRTGFDLDTTVTEFQASAVDEEGKRVCPWNYLDKFWDRFNKCTVDKLALSAEKERLSQENRDLKSLLKQFLDGISVTPEVMEGSNPLLVVTPAPVGLPVRRARDRREVVKPVVEAQHMASMRR